MSTGQGGDGGRQGDGGGQGGGSIHTVNNDQCRKKERKNTYLHMCLEPPRHYCPCHPTHPCCSCQGGGVNGDGSGGNGDGQGRVGWWWWFYSYFK